MSRPSVLLCSVIGPFGVDDAYGRKENIMELMHNQVTREQGVFSPRFTNVAFGLHLLAENIASPTTVLDFPSEGDFVREVQSGYDYVGISFIVPNLAKARRMAELVREHAPASKIILGGHGTMVPGVETMIEHDHICRGEGVRWLRRLLGEDPDQPIQHPALLTSVSRRAMGAPLSSDAATLMPGVGCPNACRFCATSHFFERSYTPYIETGADMFAVCSRLETELGVKEFFVLDENFLKRPQRARELLDLMERHEKDWTFCLFSSAETINDVGLDFLVRLGVTMIWVGVESEVDIFEKNQGVDFKALVLSLRDRGISVLASGILFLPHHNAETIQQDIQFLVGLAADYVQFMQLGPMPGTALYRDYDERGLIAHEIPFAEWHGQKRIWFRHPEFSGEESEHLLRAAFQRDYDTNGPSVVRLADTSLRGYLHLRDTTDPFLMRRRDHFESFARHMRALLPVALRHAHNERASDLVRRVTRAYDEALGPPRLRDRARSVVLAIYAARESLRVRFGRNVYQPPAVTTRLPERPLGTSRRSLILARAGGNVEAVTQPPHGDEIPGTIGIGL